MSRSTGIGSIALSVVTGSSVNDQERNNNQKAKGIGVQRLDSRSPQKNSRTKELGRDVCKRKEINKRWMIFIWPARLFFTLLSIQKWAAGSVVLFLPRHITCFDTHKKSAGWLCPYFHFLQLLYPTPVAGFISYNIQNCLKIHNLSHSTCTLLSFPSLSQSGGQAYPHSSHSRRRDRRYRRHALRASP